MQSRKRVLLMMILAASPLACKADPFGVASAYNLVALGTVATPGHAAIAGTINDSADVTGRVAAAGQILNLTSVGSDLVGSQALPDPYKSDSVVGGVSYDVVATGGLQAGLSINVNSDGSVYAKPPVSDNINFNGNGGSKGSLVTTGSGPIDFDGPNGLRATLDAQSLFLATPAAATGGGTGMVLGYNASIPGVHINPSDFVLYANNNTLDVFTITAAQFNSQGLDIHTNPGQNPTIVVNVIGGTATSNGPLQYNENQDFHSELTNKVLFNFPTASVVNITNGELSASVLAPFAVLSGGGDLDGNIIAAAIGATGEVHNIEFVGNLPSPPTPPNTPAVPEPGTLMLVGTGVLLVAGAMRGRKKAAPLS
jgi:choice-of-anchor A domain-containing protein